MVIVYFMIFFKKLSLVLEILSFLGWLGNGNKFNLYYEISFKAFMIFLHGVIISIYIYTSVESVIEF